MCPLLVYLPGLSQKSCFWCNRIPEPVPCRLCLMQSNLWISTMLPLPDAMQSLSQYHVTVVWCNRIPESVPCRHNNSTDSVSRKLRYNIDRCLHSEMSHWSTRAKITSSNYLNREFPGNSTRIIPRVSWNYCNKRLKQSSQETSGKSS